MESGATTRDETPPHREPRPAAIPLSVIPYAFAIFLSAFLLFQVEPIIARYILPWFGGTPAVWTTCMLFFQVSLLVGYAYAHFLASYLSPRYQALVHLSLVVCSLFFLPITPGEAWKPDGTENPMLAIVLLLVVTIGGPFLLVSASGPLLSTGSIESIPPCLLTGCMHYRIWALSWDYYPILFL